VSAAHQFGGWSLPPSPQFFFQIKWKIVDVIYLKKKCLIIEKKILIYFKHFVSPSMANLWKYVSVLFAAVFPLNFTTTNYYLWMELGIDVQFATSLL